MKKLIPLVFAAALASPVFAETLQFGGTPLSGTGSASTFATLTYTQVGSGDDWDFTLTAADLDSVFSASGAFIGSIAVEVPGAGSNYGNGGLPLTDVSGGVTQVRARNGGGPGGSYDFRIALGQGNNDRLTSGESVSWTWTDSGYTSFSNLALHVQGLGGNTGGFGNSEWFQGATPPVPEPGSVAMMLAGLGALGFLARRRAA